jgi:hypothetical protein
VSIDSGLGMDNGIDFLDWGLVAVRCSSVGIVNGVGGVSCRVGIGAKWVAVVGESSTAGWTGES